MTVAAFVSAGCGGSAVVSASAGCWGIGGGTAAGGRAGAAGVGLSGGAALGLAGGAAGVGLAGGSAGVGLAGGSEASVFCDRGGGGGGSPDGADIDGGPKLGGEAMELASVGDSPSELPDTSSTTMEGKRPILPCSSPSHQPSSTPLGQRFCRVFNSPISDLNLSFGILIFNFQHLKIEDSNAN